MFGTKQLSLYGPLLYLCCLQEGNGGFPKVGLTLCEIYQMEWFLITCNQCRPKSA